MTAPVEPPHWEPAGDDRWTFVGDLARHLLLHIGTRYIELNGSTVHVYDGPAAVANPDWPLGDPATADPFNPICAWVLTDQVNVASEDEAWDVMADYENAESPAPEPPPTHPPATPPQLPPPTTPPPSSGDDEEEEG